ncbi:DUF3455 domain-containing protein [Rhodanobacter sp. Si-c]|uniref:DUF3455 domain-containing protein n=1 Tax=Rhodanobacter lycopersici TaxID=3162487 RepID=A0ABV3QGN3_9GAMM
MSCLGFALPRMPEGKPGLPFRWMSEHASGVALGALRAWRRRVMRKSLKCCVLAAATLACAAQAQGVSKAAAIEAFGKGVQIYACKASGGTYAWALKAPDAILADAKGRTIGKHFAGPSWRANDGSTVVGESVNVSPSPDARAIPWLVLRAKSHAGNGEMATVQYIVRERTEGGMAPATGCEAAQAGREVRVPYSAVYLFFRG